MFLSLVLTMLLRVIYVYCTYVIEKNIMMYYYSALPNFVFNSITLEA
jgi:uncharacterized protein with PQ loop repeat